VDNNEVFQIMNLLDPVLRTSNSGSVLATIKCFLHLTRSMPDLKPQVYARIKPPMLTLIAGGIPELVYCLLKHVDFLVNESPGSFDDEYRQFYVRYNDASHIKYLKVQIMAKTANETNALDIVTELSEYVSDVDSRLGRLAIQSIGEIACTEVSTHTHTHTPLRAKRVLEGGWRASLRSESPTSVLGARTRFSRASFAERPAEKEPFVSELRGMTAQNALFASDLREARLGLRFHDRPFRGGRFEQPGSRSAF